MKILFLIPYPLQEAPSQRFRFEQYFTALHKAGYKTQIQSFLTKKNWRLFYNKGQTTTKIFVLIAGYTKRVYSLFKAVGAQYVFIHREVTPLGPPVFEWILAKVLRKKIIYDFDDAIWLTDKSEESASVRFLKWRKKTGQICAWSHRVSCGNSYLAQYAAAYNNRVVVNPTTITMHEYSFITSKKKNNQVVIGWTGSHSTLKYLTLIENIICQIQHQFREVTLLVIADKKPELTVPRWEFIYWTKESEVNDLLKIDIGIMPLPDDEWTKGKCGFKALQYMALGIPSVVSPVGVNTTIITHQQNGMLAKSADEWKSCLEALITEPSLRKILGDAGKQTIINHYSTQANTPTYLSLFN